MRKPSKSRGRGRAHRQRRHTRKFSHTGGGDIDIEFILEDKNGTSISFDNIASLAPDKTYKITMNVKQGGSLLPICNLEFEFNQVGELKILSCMDVKLEPYIIKSYLIINIFLQVLKHSHGIRTVFLMPLSDKDKGFIKLYNFYKNMGFVCIGEFRQLEAFQEMSDEDRLKFLSEKKAESDAMLKRLTDKGKLSKHNMTELMMNGCMYMAGSVDDILSTTRAKITEWDTPSP